MAKKTKIEKDNSTYKWVKIIQSFLLIVFGVVLCAFSSAKGLQDALGYITGSIILLYGILTIGFGLIFDRGLLSAENISGAAQISLAILIYVNPNIVMEYIPAFAGILLLTFGGIFLIEAVLSTIKKYRNIGLAVFSYIMTVVMLCLGTTTLVLTFSSDENNKELIKMILIIMIGVILILTGIALIFYYSISPKFKNKPQEEPEEKAPISEGTIDLSVKERRKNNKAIENVGIPMIETKKDHE